MPKSGITLRDQDYSQWYLDIVQQAELCDYAEVVKGCIVFKPTGYAIWERMQRGLDDRIKDTGHENAYLPLLINQWANVMRAEMRTRPFLRTAEFLWQEGHTVHADEADAERETLMILEDVYADFAEREMAMPVIRGLKTENEKFPGALRSYCIEAMMQDARALQVGTSHNLGQNFAKAFDISFTDQNNTVQHAWTTSWGISTRLIGALIMAHSDDEGLVVPPRLAPTQVVVVPIYKNDAEQDAVLAAVEQITAQWKGRLRFKIDDRDNLTPGFKFNEIGRAH